MLMTWRQSTYSQGWSLLIRGASCAAHGLSSTRRLRNSILKGIQKATLSPFRGVSASFNADLSPAYKASDFCLPKAPEIPKPPVALNTSESCGISPESVFDFIRLVCML